MKREVFPFVAVALTAGVPIAFVPAAFAGPHDALIAKHAAVNSVPEHLVRRVIRLESRGNAAVVHRGNYGLMQIRLGTARGVGYSGDAKGLLDPDTNLTYAVKYLAGAYRAAGCDADRAVSYYQRGYHGTAKHECGAPPATVVQFAKKTRHESRRGVCLRKTEFGYRRGKARRRDQAQGGRTKLSRRRSRVSLPRGRSGISADILPFSQCNRIAAANPMPPRQEPASKADRIATAATEPAAKFELASVPLPPVRPELDPAPKQTVPPVHHPERARKRADRKSKASAQPSFASNPRPTRN